MAKILMIGGTGNISTAVSELLLRQGHELHLLCRNGITDTPALSGVSVHLGDSNDEAGMSDFLQGKNFDCAVNWVVWDTGQAERDIRLFEGKTAQYIFISTASAYQKPPASHIVTEKTPLSNPYWEYSRKKIACEQAFMSAYEKRGFPATIVRPSLTYGQKWIPYAMASDKSWSLIDRIRKGKRVIVPGDGTSLWTVTNSTDFAQGFAGLAANRKAIGEDFHITSDEVLTWDTILDQIGEAVGTQPQKAHISTEFITAFMPQKEGSLLGDKVNSLIFDNSKLRRFVPDYKPVIPFREGIKKTVAFLQSQPSLQTIDEPYEAMIDKIIAAHDYGKGMAG
jgi:nucleoside-diphosphate-sugar epimerase